MEVDSKKAETFEEVWQTPSGYAGWFKVVNNQPLGKRFMLTAFIFFALGGILALLMRVQLTVSENTFLGPEVYNRLFTMHGSTMMYLFSVPFLEGLALYMLPLMLGSRDVAFPRLTAFGYWTYLFGGVIFYMSFLFDMVPDAGWFAYTPLSGPLFAEKGLDFFLLGLSMVELAGITAGIEIVVTILKLRAPGMSINRMPLFAWAMLVVGIMIIFAFTVLFTATVMLEIDRAFGTRFFDPGGGGSSLLWQHLFWFFGHPEVYIMFIPATGIISMVVPVFARRPISGYILIVLAIVVTGFISFGLWVHHMYATGLPELSMSFFTAASLMIGIASGIQIFSWIATMWGRKPVLNSAMLYVLGFIVLFTIGGITGIMVAVVTFDWQVHDTFFIVAHFHYVIIGGVVFPIFAGLYYWLPKFTGRMLDERLGKWNFWLTFIGFNLTFFPMHLMGFYGMPRRVYTYPSILGLDGQNMIATAGAFMLAVGFLVFVWNVYVSLRSGKEAGSDPWEGETLEWLVESPPRSYSFYAPPVVRSRHPLWYDGDLEHSSEQIERVQKALTAAPQDWRATLSTDVLNAQPQAVQYLPGPSYTPLYAAIGVLIASLGMLAEVYLVTVFGLIFLAGTLVTWLWPRDEVLQKLYTSSIGQEAGLPIFTTGTRSTAWWGMVCFITTVAVVFGAMFFSYFYIRVYSVMWPQDNLPLPDLLPASIAFLLLVASAGPIFWAARSFRRDQDRPVKIGLLGGILLGAAFLVFQVYELGRLDFVPQANAYASLFYVISWLLDVTVLIGLALNVAAYMRFSQERYDRRGYLALQVQITALYWYFVAAAGLLVFGVLYLSPYLI